MVSAVTDTYSHTVMLPAIFQGFGSSPMSSHFGVQMYGALNESSAALSVSQAGQVYWIRWPVGWASVEPAERSILISTTGHTPDANFSNAANAGHQLIATINHNPTWAATYRQGPIDLVPISQFTDFVGAMVERYDGDGYLDAPGSPVVRYFEFYNEPDATNLWAAEQGYGGYWGDYGADYAEMLCASYPVVKAASPGAQVVFGGIAYDSFVDQGGSFKRAFLGDVLAAGGGDCIDYMNFHYYPVFQDTWYAYGYGLEGKANYLHDQLAAYGVPRKPMMVTEAGWHSDYYSDDFPGSHQIQSQYVVKLFAQAAAADLDR